MQSIYLAYWQFTIYLEVSSRLQDDNNCITQLEVQLGNKLTIFYKLIDEVVVKL